MQGKGGQDEMKLFKIVKWNYPWMLFLFQISIAKWTII